MIVQAACCVTIPGIEDVQCIPLHRHCDIGKIFKAFGYKPGECKIVEQGFIDNHGNFYNRKSALIHANKCAQQLLSVNYNTNELFSENLYQRRAAMLMKIDTEGEILYNKKLEQIIDSAAERVAEKILSVLTNLDNETLANKLSPVLTVEEAAKILRISKPKMYDLTKRPDFPLIRVGRKILINRQALSRWMEGEAHHG